MLQAVEFIQDYRCFTTGDTFGFFPGVNLLVGDQGCGKSTLLQVLRNCGSKLKMSDRAHKKDKQAKIIFNGKSKGSYAFDFEHDNVRTKSYFGDNIEFQVHSMVASHGETNMAMFKAMEKAEEAIIFLDEPGMALSIRSAKKVAEGFERAVERGCQIIAAVHNLVIIQQFETVLSLEHRTWMGTDDFIASQYEN